MRRAGSARPGASSLCSLRSQRAEPLERARAGRAAVILAGLLVAGAASPGDPKALVIEHLQGLVRREMKLELTLRDVGYDLWAKKTVLDGMELRTPGGAAVAKAERVVIVADLLAFGTGGSGSVATASLVSIQKGDLFLDVDRPPRADKSDAREARLDSLVVKESKLTVVKGGKPHVELSDLDVKGTALAAGAAGWGSGTLVGTVTAKVASLKIAAAHLSFGIKIGETLELRLDSKDGGCGLERTFALADILSGKVDAAALVREAIAPCAKPKR